jgi:hypothetical protein
MAPFKSSTLAVVSARVLLLVLICDLVADFAYFAYSAFKLRTLQLFPWSISGLLHRASPLLGYLSTLLVLGLIALLLALGLTLAEPLRRSSRRAVGKHGPIDRPPNGDPSR